MPAPSSTFHEDLGREQETKGSSDRSFGLVFAAFFALVGLSPLRHHLPARVWALAISGVFLLVALIRPSTLRLLNRAWMKLGLLLGKLVNPVVTALLFYVVVTPFALLFRLMGKDPLRLRMDPQATTYWIERQPPGPEPQTMANQF